MERLTCAGLSPNFSPVELRKLSSTPQADNARACRAYEKAGFGRMERRIVSGEAIMLMYFTPDTR